MPSLELHSSPDGTSTSQVELPKDVFLDVPSRDLLLRLLEVQPQKRLRSVRALGSIAFYKGYNFERVREKEFKARDFLVKHFGEDYHKAKNELVTFNGFDEVFIKE